MSAHKRPLELKMPCGLIIVVPAVSRLTLCGYLTLVQDCGLKLNLKLNFAQLAVRRQTFVARGVVMHLGTFRCTREEDKIYENFENIKTWEPKHVCTHNMTNFTRGATPGLTHFLMGGSLNSCPTRIKPRADFVAGIPILNHKNIKNAARAASLLIRLVALGRAVGGLRLRLAALVPRLAEGVAVPAVAGDGRLLDHRRDDALLGLTTRVTYGLERRVDFYSRNTY